jgi:hypothetical protein
MFVHHVYTDPRLPDLQIKVTPTVIQFLEGDKLIKEIRMPQDTELSDYLHGLFDGIYYFQSEIRQIRLSKKGERDIVSTIVS